MARRYCDLVMKGGITSGLVYPSAAISLAREYTFKNVGGTSAGAIAAAACAAAALGQRRKELQPRKYPDGDAMGFAGLESVAEDLSSKGFIYSLFQPGAGVRSVYRLLVAAAGKKGFLAIGLALFWAMVWSAGLIFLASLLLLLGLAYAAAGVSGLIAAALPALLCALVASLAWSVARAATTIRANQMGICTGMRPQGARNRGKPALTEWLHTVIQSLSGQPQDDPLRFEHLWKAQRYPEEPETRETLTLRVITTSVSHHEPRSLPLEKGGGQFWFRREEFDRLFPESVVDWMVAQGTPRLVSGKTYHPLPGEGTLPVIVAARMSLSFPLLISAVPLYEPDFTATSDARVELAAATQPARRLDATDALTAGGARAGDAAPDRPFRICWFSDGGISSNFPIHLFDAPLPRWPTFAIDLIYAGTDDARPREVSLRPDNVAGWSRRYTAIERPSAIAEVAAFLFGIIGTMQNWRDLLLSRAPGYRGRIVSVPLAPNEGGLNLDMPEEVLRSIAAKGSQAGQVVVDQFDFNCHWWTRWRNVAASTERFVIAFHTGAAALPSDSYKAAYLTATSGKPPAPCYKLSAAQTAEAQMRFMTLSGLGQAWADPAPSLQKGAPRPLPYMTISPVY